MAINKVKRIIDSSTIELESRWEVKTKDDSMVTGVYVRINGIKIAMPPAEGFKNLLSNLAKNLLAQLRLQQLLMPENKGAEVDIVNPKSFDMIKINDKDKKEEEVLALVSDVFLKGINIANYFPEYKEDTPKTN